MCIRDRINTTPSLYLEAGAIHGCVLAQKDEPLVYMEDVGRHNAVDKIAGWMFRERVPAHDKIFYTTGRLTSEMVIKTVRMGIPILVLSLIHISEPTRQAEISYAVFCLKKK